LEEIPAEDYLYPAKRGAPVIALYTQGRINRIHDISPHHGDFVNDQGLQFLKEFGVLASPDALGVDNRWRKLKEGMDRLAADIERRYTCGSQNDRGLGSLLPQVVQEGRFSRPGLSREKDALALSLNEVKSVLELVIQLDLREIRRSFRHSLERGRNDTLV